ncbi:Anion exchange transporter [Fukomys damarensis]|uniref:Anion exchange transporter n=1 Tax=Fukomys damarensis TaxID=885580 RepID=A0A091DBC3_FUKDA|nr:Anion exchange transporter [Fukomys damarensis]
MTGAKRKKKSVRWSKMHTLHCEDIKQWCRRRLPILEWAPRYNLKENLLPDTVSGIMLAVQQVTQGLAFAILSSVHPVFGLYGSLFPAIIYAIFGMGRHVATGTFALTSLISANAVERLVPQSSQNLTKHSNSSLLGLSEFEAQRIGVAAAVSFLGGVIQVAMFVLQLGSATFLLTEPVISAMTTGAATHVVTSQVKYLLGIKIPYISGPLGLFYIYAYVFENIKSVQLEALLLSLLSIVVLVLVKELNEQFKRKIKVVLPVDLVLCVLASIIVVGLKGMLIQFRDLKKYWNVDKIDWGIWVSTYIFTICFAANVGLLFGVVCTIAVVIGRFPRAKTLSIKNMKEIEFKVKTETDDETTPQVKIISINNPLVFLNVKKFHTDLKNTIQRENPSNHPLDDISKCEQNTLLNSLSNGSYNEEASQPCLTEKWSLVLDCSGLTFFDYSGVSMLVEVYTDCKDMNVDVSLANCTDSLIKAMKYYGNLDSERPIFFESVSAAISNISSNKVS